MKENLTRRELLTGVLAGLSSVVAMGAAGAEVKGMIDREGLSVELREKMKLIDAKLQVAFRDSVDANRFIMSYMGAEITLPEYKSLLDSAVDLTVKGDNPFSEDFWKRADDHQKDMPNAPTVHLSLKSKLERTGKT